MLISWFYLFLNCGEEFIFCHHGQCRAFFHERSGFHHFAGAIHAWPPRGWRGYPYYQLSGFLRHWFINLAAVLALVRRSLRAVPAASPGVAASRGIARR